ncbi:hypothetical protein MSG28_000802 [Choristoneura fumiferana]|uniref:Uncharacterized protein n=1 Tax=Choristoneura fumiferana TaxID=7141 RepID=A0ACC0K333_CHOFU|nr:hypothetical protein MSG28_000802 [Choristoneura fumiferana]
MELHPIISENYDGLNPMRRVTFTCKYRAPEPLTIQFYYERKRISAPKHYNTSKLYPDGWRGEHETKLIWDTRHVGKILECHTITSKGFTLGVLTSTLPEPDGEPQVVQTTTNRPPPPQSTVTVTISSPTIRIENVGGQVNFTCEARSRMIQGALPVNWTKVDGHLPQGRTYVDRNTGVLYISRVQVSDSGTYICQTSDGISTGQAIASLTVGSNPMTIPTVSIQPSVNEYYEGDRIELECVTTGNPIPKIVWQRASGQPLPLAVEYYRSYLVIPKAREEDSGEYRCIARNTAGSKDSIAAIFVRPRPLRPTRDRLTISPSTPNVVEGQSTNVICTGTASIPVGSIGWVRQDGSELAQNVRSENGVLYIDVARLENQGVYVCQTTSEQAASVPILVTVVPLSTPAPGEAPSISVSVDSLKIPTGGSGTIDCNPQGYPQPYIKWSKHNNNFGPGTSQRGNTLIISNAQDEDGGYYMCTGSVDGTVVANTYVMVEIETRIPPKVEIWPQGELAVTLGGQFEFHCRVLAGVPPPEILWSRSRERSLSRSTHLQPQAVLKFERIEVNDEGEYICTATNVAGQASANATLKVRSVPEITLTPGSFIEANPGEPVEVHCRANGYPEPMVSIKLRSDDRELVPPSPGIASLRVGAANERDDGDYVCTAVSAAGTVAEQFTIRVERGDIGFGPNGEGSGETDFDPYGNPDQDQNPEQDPNYYPDQQRPTPLLAIEGQDSTLGCDSSNGLYTVQWGRVGQQLQRYAQQIGNELIIRNASKRDSGQYECVLIDRRTGITHKSAYTELLVMEQPRITLRPPTQTVRPGQSPTVECIVEGDEIQEISWKPVQRPLSSRVSRAVALSARVAAAAESRAPENKGYEIARKIRVQTRGSTLIFRQIEVEDAGRYECFTKNRVANASAVAQVIVSDETDLAAVESHDNEQVAKEGAVVRFSCNVPPQSRLAVRWTKNGQPLPRSVLQLADGSLFIRLAKKSDSGHYLCTIRDQYGRQTSNYINLHIEDVECLKPKFRCVDGSNCIDEKLLCDGSADCMDNSDEDCILSEEQQSNTLSEYPTLTGPREVAPALVTIEQPRRQFVVGENVEVICRAASRGVRVSWERYNTRQHVEQRPYGDGSVLILNSVAESDAGVYRCTGTDSMSSSSDDFNLEIQPENRRDETYTARLGDRAIIPCRHNLGQPVSYEWRSEFSSLPPDVRSNEPNLYLQQVSEADAGTYICTVSNGRTREVSRVVLLVTGVVPMFNGNSWLAMKRLEDAYLNFDIEISFKPMDSNGLILYNSQNEERNGDSIALQLVDSVPQMVLEVTGSTLIVKGDRPLRLNTWHTVRMSRMYAKVAMNVDDTGPFTAELPNKLQAMELKQPLYIGGVRDYNQLPSVLGRPSGFIGCVGMLILGKQEKDIMMDSIDKYQVAECDSCSPNLCLHDGICQEARNERGYVCLCPAGYAGQNCDHPGEGCRPRICGPGKCTETEDSYKCSCPITFTGPRQSIEYPAFTGSAYLAIKTPETERSLHMSMKIKAMSPVTDGIIMYCAESELGHGGFTALIVREGRLEFRYQLGDGSSPVILTSHYPLPANEWTEVNISRTVYVVLLRINQNYDICEGRLDSPKPLHLSTALYVGGVDDSNIVLNNNTGVTGGFSGCIKDVTVQAGPVNIVTASIESNNVTECTHYERGDIPEERPGLSPPLTRAPLPTRRVPGYSDPCREQPCRNRGTCRPDPSSRFNYTCDCPLGYAGTHCHMTLELHTGSPVGFDGNGYLELAAENLHYSENPVVIAITINSRSDNGVILYHRESAADPSNGDFILLRVENGHVVFEWDQGDGASRLAVENVDVSDGLRHNIIVKMNINSREVELTVEQTTQTETYAGLASVMHADSNIYLGGIPERLNVNGHPGLTGCIVSVEFTDRGRSLNLGAAAVAGRNVQRCKDLDVHSGSNNPGFMYDLTFGRGAAWHGAA